MSPPEPSTEQGVTLPQHPDLVQAVVFSPDGRTLATGSQDGTIKLWDADSTVEKATLKGSLNWLGALAFSPDGKTLAAGGDDIELWDSATKKIRISLKDSGRVAALAFSPDGKLLARGGHDRAGVLWDLTNSKQRAMLTGHINTVSSVAFSPDGKTLITGSFDYTVKVWDAAGWRLQTTLKGHSGGVSSVAFSPDGKTLAAGTWNGGVVFWDVATWQPRESFPLPHPGGVYCLAYDPNGKTLVSGGCQYLPWQTSAALVDTGPEPLGEARLWDIASGELLIVLKGHQLCVSSAAFSPDGKRVATGSRDLTVKLWEMDDLLQKSKKN